MSGFVEEVLVSIPWPDVPMEPTRICCRVDDTELRNLRRLKRHGKSVFGYVFGARFEFHIVSTNRTQHTATLEIIR